MNNNINNCIYFANNIQEYYGYDYKENSTVNNFVIERHFVNLSSFDLSVENSNGITLTVNRDITKNKGILIVIDKYVIPYRDYDDVFNGLKQHPDFTDHRTATYKLFKIIESVNNSSKYTGSFTVSIATYIDEQDLKDNLSVYSTSLDLNIFIKGNTDIPKHPFSSVSEAEKIYNNQRNNFFGTTVAYEIVANNDQINTRYIRIGHKVVHINPIKDNTRMSGIYIHRIYYGSNPAIKIPPEYFPLTELDKLEEIGLYRTIDEAMVGGDIGVKNQLELKNAELEIEKLKLNFKQSTEEHKQAEHIRNIEFEQKAAETLMLKEELQRQQLEYQERIARINSENELLRQNQDLKHRAEMAKLEKQNQERKNKTEIIKIATAVATGAVTVFMAMRKGKK